MNPIEFLRYLALSGGDARVGASLSTAIEAAHALSYVAGEAELVMACRRLLAAHPHSGRLWTLTATMCGSAEPVAAAHRWVDAAERDATYEHVPDDAVLTSALLVGPSQVVIDDDERWAGEEHVLVAPFGTAVPAEIAAVATEVLAARGSRVCVSPLADFDAVVGPAGLVGVGERASDCAVAAELLRGLEADVHRSRRAGG